MLAATAHRLMFGDALRPRVVGFGSASYSTLRTELPCCGQNFGDANEIVGGRGQHEEPFHQAAAAMSRLAQATDRLHPPERFFDPLALDCTDAIAGMPGRARVDRRP